MAANTLTPAQRLYRIVEEGMCTGCGLCQSLAGPDTVRVEKVASGYERPLVVGELDDETVDRIYQVCPGNRVEGLPSRLIATDTRVDAVWGPWLRMVHGWAKDSQVRFEGSTGGVLTALASYLIASGRVAFVLHVKASRQHPTFGERHLSFSHADVMEAAGSRYGPAAPLIDIRQILDRSEPFAFIGKPCDIAALRNFARLDDRVDTLVRYWLAPVCGGYMAPEYTERFVEDAGIAPAELAAVRYRGLGCPGPVRLEAQDGRVVEKRYSDFWSEDEESWTLPFRCKVCPDGIGEAADIVAADSWPNCIVDPATESSDPGTNAVITRTETGTELIAAAVRDGALALGPEIGPRDMDLYQPHQVDKKYAAHSRLEGLEAEGRIGLKHKRLRLAELSAEKDESFHLQQRDGTRRRVREGRAGEATPGFQVTE